MTRLRLSKAWTFFGLIKTQKFIKMSRPRTTGRGGWNVQENRRIVPEDSKYGHEDSQECHDDGHQNVNQNG